MTTSIASGPVVVALDAGGTCRRDMQAGQAVAFTFVFFGVAFIGVPPKAEYLPPSGVEDHEADFEHLPDLP